MAEGTFSIAFELLGDDKVNAKNQRLLAGMKSLKKEFMGARKAASDGAKAMQLLAGTSLAGITQAPQAETELGKEIGQVGQVAGILMFAAMNEIAALAIDGIEESIGPAANKMMQRVFVPLQLSARKSSESLVKLSSNISTRLLPNISKTSIAFAKGIDSANKAVVRAVPKMITAVGSMAAGMLPLVAAYAATELLTYAAQSVGDQIAKNQARFQKLQFETTYRRMADPGRDRMIAELEKELQNTTSREEGIRLSKELEKIRSSMNKAALEGKTPFGRLIEGTLVGDLVEMMKYDNKGKQNFRGGINRAERATTLEFQKQYKEDYMDGIKDKKEIEKRLRGLEIAYGKINDEIDKSLRAVVESQKFKERR